MFMQRLLLTLRRHHSREADGSDGAIVVAEDALARNKAWHQYPFERSSARSWMSLWLKKLALMFRIVSKQEQTGQT